MRTKSGSWFATARLGFIRRAAMTKAKKCRNDAAAWLADRSSWGRQPPLMQVACGEAAEGRERWGMGASFARVGCEFGGGLRG
jgi:hypothetical protein